MLGKSFQARNIVNLLVSVLSRSKNTAVTQVAADSGDARGHRRVAVDSRTTTDDCSASKGLKSIYQRYEFNILN